MQDKFISIFFMLTLGFTHHAFCQTKSQLDSLRGILEDAFEKDQSIRHNIDSLQKLYGYNLIQLEPWWRRMHRIDSANTHMVSSVLDKFGWIGISETSERANEGLFTCLQHADAVTQKKYLPCLKDAVLKGMAKKSYYPYLFDRVCMMDGKFQLFGTQISGDYKGNLIFWPIKNAVYVNKRRRAYGLQSIEEYAKSFNIEYIPSQKDSLKNKVKVTFFCYSDSTALSGVKIYTGGNKPIGISNTDGVVVLLLNKRILSRTLRFQRAGYENQIFDFSEKEKDVYFSTIEMKKN